MIDCGFHIIVTDLSAEGGTLEELATPAGVSGSTLSRLESGKRQASLELLLPLTRRLGIRIDDLLPAETRDPRVHRPIERRDGMVIAPLTLEDSPMQALKIVYPPADAAPAGPNATARYYDAAFRSDTIEIMLPPDQGNELEYKVKMKTGATLVYAFTVTGDEEHPEWFYYDFHGEQRPAPADGKPIVMEYRQTTGISGNGALVATGLGTVLAFAGTVVLDGDLDFMSAVRHSCAS